jgi:hypothetical protein
VHSCSTGIRHHQSVIEQNQQGVAINFAQNYTGDLMEGIVGFEEKQEIHDRSNGSYGTGFNDEAYDFDSISTALSFMRNGYLRRVKTPGIRPNASSRLRTS